MSKPQLRIMITGGAGGIAEAVLQQLGARFAGAVGLIDIDADGLDRLQAEHMNEDLSVIPFALDLREREALQSAVEEFSHHHGGLDILFANAGVMTGAGPFEVEDPDAIDRSVDLNFRAVAASVQIAWPHLSQGGGQVIVNASGAGLNPLPSDVIYSASKAAAIMFARASALRAPETGIRFNVVCPGVVDTPILNDSRTGKWRDEVHGFAEHFELIQPAEIADAVLGLISNGEANGEVLDIRNRRKT
ncbi:NADP-dependent 3-hydroxy acid dehydrogenase YdfG [Parasphingorhabdus marina DSM 22363]|uniref:NADP-dependent 3-hydroxy acid dehydrogenase YdfG n=1 Tax=Parasphingorhabdus marina DSM 22363 TaxID=1123272 RepID=A0A1N6D1G2_9SPHN|nr:SDR family oxidoreductase [Parasphingorhabdus marina]SIN64628.1 NADP-dependent 3-hydroxy acid dehydrogenase YdfG [Parasphingorhabdus marina DSM 22363]